MMLRALRRFRRCEEGLAVMEFAFGLPVLLIILLGCFDAARFVLINQKMARVAAQTSDLVAQLDVVTESEMSDLWVSATDTAMPFDIGTEGRVIVSSVFRPYTPADADPEIVWQRLTAPGLNSISRLGVEDDEDPPLPTGFSLRSGENVIVAEVFFDYSPVFFGEIFAARVLYYSSYNRPRLQNLTAITDD